jgi:GTP pyrophosphokinase
VSRAAAPVPLGQLFDDALLYAVEGHRHDVRKVSNVPYVAHLLGVCSIVLENGGSEIEAAAALLHDLAEDHGGLETLRAIEGRFGPEVSGIVAGCSDSFEAEGAKKAPWLERKQAYITHLAMLARDPRNEPVLLVSASDKLYNLRSIRDDMLRLQPNGDEVYRRFSAGKWGTLWYYRTLADVYATVEGRHRFVARELSDLAVALADGRSARELLAMYLA